jgi:hypothetical protein
MKRTRLLLVCLILAVAILTPATAQEPETFARFVPEGAVFYATTQNFESVWRGIERSNFWAKLTRLNLWEGVDFGWYDDFRETFAESLGFEFSTENVMAVFGKEFAVALYIEAGEEHETGAKVELIFVCRMNPADAVETMVDKLVEHAKGQGDDVVISAVEHRGAKVRSIRAKDDVPAIQLRWAISDDVLIAGIGNGPPNIEGCLDCMAGEGAPLAANKDVAKLLAMARRDRGTFLSEMYFSLGECRRVLTEYGGDEPELAPLINMLDMMSASAEAIALTTRLDRGLRIKLAMEPGAEAAELMALVSKAPPSTGTHVKYIPPDALMYFGANSMPPFAELWPHMMKQWAKFGFDERVRDVTEQIELALDLDFKTDLLDNLGTEFAFTLEGLDMDDGPFPFPKMTLLFQVKDTAKAQALIDKIVALLEGAASPEEEITVTDLVHQGAKLKTVAIARPPGIELTPTIGITENFLFISSGEDYAKATLLAGHPRQDQQHRLHQYDRGDEHRTRRR